MRAKPVAPQVLEWIQEAKPAGWIEPPPQPSPDGESCLPLGSRWYVLPTVALIESLAYIGHEHRQHLSSIQPSPSEPDVPTHLS